MASTKSVEIIKSIAVLGTNDKGWSKELNLVSWYGHDPKYEIRDWSEDHEKLGKGVMFSSKEELNELKHALNQMDLVSDDDE